MNYINILKANNLKATPQRLGVLKILANKEHPTIDEIYQEIKQKNPSISLATIYKNIKSLLDYNIITELNILNQKKRYDLLDKEHIHLVCNKCGNIQDIDCSQAELVAYKKMLKKSLKNDILSLSIVVNSKTCAKCEK